MKINFQSKGIIVTVKQKKQMERKILRMKKFVKDYSPIVVDLTLIDESGPEKGGVDQAVHISMTLPGDKIFIEEVDDRIMRAFNFAVRTLERRLKRNNRKFKGDKRRQSRRFKALTNVVGAPIRFVGSAGKAVGKYMPKRRGKKRKK